MTTPPASIERPAPILIPPKVAAAAIGNTYPPAAAAILPLESTVIVVPSGITPPSADVVAAGNEYAAGTDGLLRICANPVVAFQSD